MSSGRKQQKKRKRQSSPPFKSQIALRLEKLRGRKRDLWADDGDDDDTNEQSKATNNKKSSVALSDYDEEVSASPLQRRLRSTKSKNKISQNHNKNATCLICSIISQLSSFNCCSQHLTVLKNPQQSTTTSPPWLPEQVMIIPVTDDIVQRYLDPEQIQHLRTQTLTNDKTSERHILTQKSINKPPMTLDVSEGQQEQPSKNSSRLHKSVQMDIPPIASAIVIESARSNSATVPPDITITTISSPISPINNMENIIPIDTNLLQESFIIDDNPQENTIRKSTHEQEQTDPWIPISDEIDAALEHALDQIDSSIDLPREFTPTTARRTETEFMAACLPKLTLNLGRFHNGKPINDPARSNAANEYRPLAAAQSSLVTPSIITTNVHPPPTASNIEKEPPCQNSNRPENTIDDDIATNSLFTQDERNQYDNISTTLSSEVLAPVSVINENSNTETEVNRANGTHGVTSSTTNDINTPIRKSFLLNPDGTRVSVSRPSLRSLRRASTDTAPTQPNTKQV